MRRDPIRLLAVIFGGLGAVFLVLGIGLGLALPAFIGPLMFLTFGLVGGIFLCVGLGFAVHLHRRRLLREDLLRHGERIEAEILGLEPNPNIRINGRHPMRLVCRYTENGVDCICRSENLSGYPHTAGNTVAVYRDPQDHRRYFVDAESALIPTVEL